MLVRCLYASRTVEPLAQHALESILEKSRKNNMPRGITGLLCYNDGTFVQVLEGGREAVSVLLGALFTDNRHTGLQMLLFEEIPERHFGNWTMGKVNIDSVNGAALLKYSETASLDPFRNTGRATLSLLIDLAATGSIASRH